MAQVVVDANVLIAARLERDTDHDRGRRIANAIDRGDLPEAYVPDDVLEEIINYLQRKASHGAAAATLDAVVESGGYEVVFTPKADFDAGRSLFRKYETLSLTDAIIVAFMHREGIEHLYSFDDGFDGVEGITRFVTPENPFEP